jgi:glycosyltransferase involved in cell wall biosynthesis
MLRVVHISAWDNVGGSGRSAYRIHLGLKRRGVQSRMLVGWKGTTGDPDVQRIRSGWLDLLDRACHRVTERLSLQYLCYPSSMILPWRRWVLEADVIQLYNTHGGYFSHTVLPALSRLRPVVWRLSDMWPMTGHCAYSFGCERWTRGCGACPILEDYPALRRDRTAFLWRMKQRIYERSRLTLVAPSRWMAGLAHESALLSRFPVSIIPNGLDTELFQPMPKLLARKHLGLDPDKRYLLFGAHNASESRKGGRLLVEALDRLAAGGNTDLELLVMGRGAERGLGQGRFPVRSLGEVQDDRLLATAYSAAELFVLPTLADNLPNTVLEAMAGGAPVVATDVAPFNEHITDGVNGLLVPAAESRSLPDIFVASAEVDVERLAAALRQMSDDPFRARLKAAARRTAEERFDWSKNGRALLELVDRLAP